MRILLIDDHKMFIDGLAEALKSLPNVKHLTIKNSASAALEHLDEGHVYHLIMLDLNMPDINGFQFMEVAYDRGFHFPIAILSGSEDPKDFVKLQQYNISAYISKSSSIEELHESLKLIEKGEVAMPEDYAVYFNTDHESNRIEQIAKQYKLPKRKLEIITCISLGMTNREIAEKLFVATSTIDGHVKEIYKKLDVSNRAECINKSKSLGLI